MSVGNAVLILQCTKLNLNADDLHYVGARYLTVLIPSRCIVEVSFLRDTKRYKEIQGVQFLVFFGTPIAQTAVALPSQCDCRSPTIVLVVERTELMETMK